MKTTILIILGFLIYTPLMAKSKIKFSGKVILMEAEKDTILNIKNGDPVEAIIELDNIENADINSRTQLTSNFRFNNSKSSFKYKINSKVVSSSNSNSTNNILLGLHKDRLNKVQRDYLVIRSYDNSTSLKDIKEVHLSVQLDSKEKDILKNVDALPNKINLEEWKLHWGATMSAVDSKTGKPIIIRSSIESVEIEKSNELGILQKWAKNFKIWWKNKFETKIDSDSIPASK